MFAPFSRQQLQSPASYYSADISAVACVSNSAAGSPALPDTGFAASGFCRPQFGGIQKIDWPDRPLLS